MKKSLLHSWKVLHWLHTITYLFSHICCIVDGIVHFIWTRGGVNNYRTLSVEFIVINFKKGNIISLHDFLVFQYILSTCQQAFSFSHKIQFIYFPIYFLLEACAHDLRLAAPERTTTRVKKTSVGESRAGSHAYNPIRDSQWDFSRDFSRQKH